MFAEEPTHAHSEVSDVHSPVVPASNEVLDAFNLFQDMCLMTNAEKPIWLPKGTPAIGKLLGLELIETSIRNYGHLFEGVLSYTSRACFHSLCSSSRISLSLFVVYLCHFVSCHLSLHVPVTSHFMSLSPLFACTVTSHYMSLSPLFACPCLSLIHI